MSILHRRCVQDHVIRSLLIRYSSQFERARVYGPDIRHIRLVPESSTGVYPEATTHPEVNKACFLYICVFRLDISYFIVTIFLGLGIRCMDICASEYAVSENKTRHTIEL
jgi:hypothetical protein